MQPWFSTIWRKDVFRRRWLYGLRRFACCGGERYAKEDRTNLIYEFARRMLEEQQKNERLRQELDRAKPKADYYDAFIHPESCTNIRATAKELKVPEKMFTAFLIRKRYLYRAPSGGLMPYAKAADDGLFFVKDYIAVNGHQGVYTLVTPKGKALFLSMMGEIA